MLESLISCVNIIADAKYLSFLDLIFLEIMLASKWVITTSTTRGYQCYQLYYHSSFQQSDSIRLTCSKGAT